MSLLSHAHHYAHGVEQPEHLIVVDLNAAKPASVVRFNPLTSAPVRSAPASIAPSRMDWNRSQSVRSVRSVPDKSGFAKPAAGKAAARQFRPGEVGEVHFAGVKTRACLDLLAAQGAAEVDLGELRSGEIAIAHLNAKKLCSIEDGERQVARRKHSPLQITEGKAAAFGVFTGEVAALEAGRRHFGVREAARHEPTVRKGCVRKDGIGELNLL